MSSIVKQLRDTVLRTGLLGPLAHPVDPQRTILIFAQPRGGSTWLEGMLRTIPRTATIWEPLDLANNKRFAQIGFHWRQHIPEDAEWPEAKRSFEELFTGRMLSKFLLQATTDNELRNADRLIVKFVRGNLLLPWLVKNFELPKPILLIRHPCAVIASMIKKGGWETLPVDIQFPAHYHDELLQGYKALVGTTRTLVEKLAVMWCIAHKMLLEHPLNDRAWTTITYEEMILDPERTLNKVFKNLELAIPDAALELARKPSRTTTRGSKVQDPQEQLKLWRKHLTVPEQESIYRILDIFHIDLYRDSTMPKILFNSLEHKME